MEPLDDYTLSDSWRRRVAVLDWIAANGGSVGSITDLGSLFDDAADHEAKMTLAADLRDFERRGWLQLQEALAFGGWSCALTTRGAELIDDLRRRRGDPVARRKAARDALLRWLYEQKVSGTEWPSLPNMRNSLLAYYYGEPFSAEEIDQAGAWLKTRGYIKGDGSAQTDGPVRPAVTAKGEDLVEAGRSVGDVERPSPASDSPLAVGLHPTSTVVQITGSNNVVQAGSPGATQSAALTDEHRHAVLQVADALEGALSSLGLDESMTQEARAVASDLRTLTAEPAPDRNAIRGMLKKVSDVALAGTGTAVGSAIAALAAQALGG